VSEENKPVSDGGSKKSGILKAFLVNMPKQKPLEVMTMKGCSK